MVRGVMRYLFVLSVLGACGGGGSSESLKVKIARSALAATRSGESWKTVTANAAGEATISVDGPTMLAVVCDQPGYLNFYTLYLGPGIEDSELLDFSCPADPSTNVTVTVSPFQLDVFIGSARTLSTPALGVPAGVYDVVAIDRGTPPRFEIRRDVSITSDMNLVFDLATNGTPMVSAQLDATGADPAEGTSGYTQLITKNRTQAYTFGNTNSWVFPASALQAGDRQLVSVSTTSTTLGTRAHKREIAGTETMLSLALPPYLASVSPTLTSATWQGGPASNRFYYGIGSPDQTKLWDANMYPEWIEAGGESNAITIPDPTTIPGWQSAWSLGSTAGATWYFVANQDMKPDFLEASRTGML